jgi:hypothetical protein
MQFQGGRQHLGEGNLGAAMAFAWPIDDDRLRRRGAGIARAHGDQIGAIGGALAAV